MNRENIIRMAQEADFKANVNEPYNVTNEWVFRFAALVASAEREASVGALSALNDTYECELHKAIAAEREACAKVCELEGIRIDASYMSCAKAIRARGDKHD